MEKEDIIKRLTELLEVINGMRKSILFEDNRVREDYEGHLVIELCECSDAYRCLVDWGDVSMCERCEQLVYTPNDPTHHVRFIFRYFYDEQSLWVFPERMKENDLLSITNWIAKSIINH